MPTSSARANASRAFSISDLPVECSVARIRPRETPLGRTHSSWVTGLALSESDGAAAFATDAAVVTLPVSGIAPVLSSLFSSFFFEGNIRREPHLMHYFRVS